MRLARLDLGPGWIDLGYGEPVSIREIFIKHVGGVFLMPPCEEFLNSTYQPPKGLPKLVALLEEKYGCDIVVCNGARHGIAAIMHALKKQGHQECLIHSPYWTSTPNIIKSQGLGVATINTAINPSSVFLLTSPNNPDGFEVSNEELRLMKEEASKDGVKFIHDAAYYTPIYSNEETNQVIADATIFSFAKMWGLSGLRVGYIAVKDKTLLQGVIEHVEQSSSGVSTASQQIAYEIEHFFKHNPEKLDLFYAECRNDLEKCREELKKLNPEYLELQQCNSNSMFAWCKKGPKFDFIKSKVNVIDGEAFGKPGYVRLNIAVGVETIKNAVRRLNGDFPV